MKKYNEEKRNEVISLRKKGYSIGEISKKFNISKSAISGWVRDIPKTKIMEDRLLEKKRNDDISRSEFYRMKRIEYRRKGKEDKYINDLEYISGCMLYWAEGTKYNTICEFTNTDPEMIKFFYNFILKYFPKSKSKIKFSVICSSVDACPNEHIIDRSKKYWKDIIGDDILFMGCYINKVKNETKYPHGVCRIRFSSVEVIQQIYGSLEEIGGLEENKWL